MNYARKLRCAWVRCAGRSVIISFNVCLFFPLANRKLTSGSCVHQSIIAMAKIPDRNGGGRVSLGHSGQALVDRARWGGWKGPSGQGVIEQHVMTGQEAEREGDC